MVLGNIFSCGNFIFKGAIFVHEPWNSVDWGAFLSMEFIFVWPFMGSVEFLGILNGRRDYLPVFLWVALHLV
jgi:hypothetical protein